MKTQLRKIGLGLMLAVMPAMAGSSAAQQWAPQNGVSASFGDVATQVSAPATIQPQATNTVSVGQNGMLTGQVASIDATTKTAAGLNGLNVFFVRDGQVVKQTTTQTDGSFQIQGMQEGAYSFIAAGKTGFAAYGVYVTSQPNNSAPNLLEATTASTNYSGIQQLLQSNVPAEVRQSVASAVQAQSGESIQQTKQIRLVNNRLSGQINSLFGQSQIGNGVQVQLIKNNQPIAQVQTNAYGQFSIPDVEPGVYDFVAAASNGFAAGRFEAVGNTNPMKQIAYRKMATQLDACLTCPSQSVAQPIDYAMEPSYSSPVEYAGESIAYGGASGGCAGCSGNYSNFSGGGVVRGRFGGRFGARLGGGGGFAGGGGGIAAGGAGMGRLLMLGGLASGVVAIADDEVAPASPVNSN